MERDTDNQATTPERIADYAVTREVGRGSVSICYEARHEASNQHVAVKVLRSPEQAFIAELQRVVARWQALDHPNLETIREFAEFDGTWCLITDFVTGDDFLHYVRPDDADYERLGSALRQLLAGLAALHENRMVHRDIRPQNCLVSGNHLVLLECDLVAIQDDDTAEDEIDPSRDMHAVGLMLYEALTGTRLMALGPATSSPTEPDLAPSQRPGVLQPGIPPALEALCLSLLAAEPKSRPTAASLLDRAELWDAFKAQ